MPKRNLLKETIVTVNDIHAVEESAKHWWQKLQRCKMADSRLIDNLLASAPRVKIGLEDE
jgi:hypothetical protein